MTHQSGFFVLAWARSDGSRARSANLLVAKQSFLMRKIVPIRHACRMASGGESLAK